MCDFQKFCHFLPKQQKIIDVFFFFHFLHSVYLILQNIAISISTSNYIHHWPLLEHIKAAEVKEASETS